MQNRRNSESVLITSDGIKNSLRKFNPLQALTEYVWNGFDALASRIDISISGNELLGNNSISIRDNGMGIERALLQNKFKPFFQSEKVFDPGHKCSASHGKNGVGRLTFFTFANFAEWETTYKKDDCLCSYKIKIRSAELQEYNPESEIAGTGSSGTTVTFSDIITEEITADTARQYLAKEFCWFLELNKARNFSIYINGEKLSYTDYITQSETQNYTYEQTGLVFTVRYLCWNVKLPDYSRYYYLNSQDIEVAKETTTLNNKGDHFYHSVYIKSKFFDSFSYDKTPLSQLSISGFYHKKSPEFAFIMQQVNRHLYDIRRPFIKKMVSKVIDSLEIESAFPNYNPKNPLDQYRKGQVSDMISAMYFAQPKMFTGSMNKEQKKTFIRLLDLILESGEVDSLFKILNEILDMTEDERSDLEDILKYTHLSNIAKTIRLIKDRYQAIADLKSLVFNPDLGANEVKHLQRLIEAHYWLFGEQYNLVTAAEPNFEEGLRRYLNYLHKEYEDVDIDHPDKLKQMDIFAVRQNVGLNRFENIVVELKHPKIAIGERQLSQVKQYMRVIMNISEYNASNMTWSFYLVGNKFTADDYIKLEKESNKSHGEPFLVFKAANYSIYVMTWSEVIAEFDMKYAHLNQKLQLEQDKLKIEYSTADEVIDSQRENTAIIPKEMENVN